MIKQLFTENIRAKARLQLICSTSHRLISNSAEAQCHVELRVPYVKIFCCSHLAEIVTGFATWIKISCNMLHHIYFAKINSILTSEQFRRNNLPCIQTFQVYLGPSKDISHYFAIMYLTIWVTLSNHARVTYIHFSVAQQLGKIYVATGSPLKILKRRMYFSRLIFQKCPHSRRRPVARTLGSG